MSSWGVPRGKSGSGSMGWAGGLFVAPPREPVAPPPRAVPLITRASSREIGTPRAGPPVASTAPVTEPGVTAAMEGLTRAFS
jgi:hypothetical protein